MLLFDPRPRLAESSVTVAPVNGGEVDELSCLICDDVLDGTFSRDPFFAFFSGTAGPDCTTFSFVDEAEGSPVLGGCRADSDVAIEGGMSASHELAQMNTIENRRRPCSTATADRRHVLGDAVVEEATREVS
jgi:hypothetical protein